MQLKKRKIYIKINYLSSLTVLDRFPTYMVLRISSILEGSTLPVIGGIDGSTGAAADWPVELPVGESAAENGSCD